MSVYCKYNHTLLQDIEICFHETAYIKNLVA